jgi:methionyl-tRNA synthetase
MSNSKNKTFIPVAWPYANGPRHIGHVAGFGVPSDVFARYKRMAGDEVLMVSGTDEHGTPMVIQADKEGITPEELVNRYNKVIVNDLVNLGLSYDLFTRTTTENHKQVVQEIFRGLKDNGYIFEDNQLVAFSPTSHHTLPDRYIMGTCPFCDYQRARGDQCDNCGKQLDPTDLIDPYAIDKDGNKETPVFEQSPQFFFDLPKLKDELRSWLETKTDWRPNVIKFSLGLLDELKPRAITRDISWGVDIPVEGWDTNPNKKLYVWFDAVVGYLSASIEWARRNNKKWEDFWQDPNVPSYYFMGKDNITFHTQIWPADLIGYAGPNSGATQPEIAASTSSPRNDGRNGHKYGKLNLPSEIVSSEFLTIKGEKFSSSQNVVIYVKDFLEEFQADALRYFIAIAGPEMQDSNFTFEDFYQRVNSELVGNWGNLVNRVLNIIHKKFGSIPFINGGSSPAPEPPASKGTGDFRLSPKSLRNPITPQNDQALRPGPKADLEQVDIELLEQIKEGFSTVGQSLNERKMRVSIQEVMRLSDKVNQYLASLEPWKLEDSDPRLKQIMFTAATAIYNLNTLFSPFLPFSSRKIYQLLGGDKDYFNVFPTATEVKDLDNSEKEYPIISGDYKLGENVHPWEFTELTPGTVIDKPVAVFTKLDIATIDEVSDRLAG